MACPAASPRKPPDLDRCRHRHGRGGRHLRRQPEGGRAVSVIDCARRLLLQQSKPSAQLASFGVGTSTGVGTGVGTGTCRTGSEYDASLAERGGRAPRPRLRATHRRGHGVGNINRPRHRVGHRGRNGHLQAEGGRAHSECAPLPCAGDAADTAAAGTHGRWHLQQRQHGIRALSECGERHQSGHGRQAGTKMLLTGLGTSTGRGTGLGTGTCVRLAAAATHAQGWIADRAVTSLRKMARAPGALTGVGTCRWWRSAGGDSTSAAGASIVARLHAAANNSVPGWAHRPAGGLG